MGSPCDDGKLPSPAKLKKKGLKVSWKAVPAAAGYVILIMTMLSVLQKSRSIICHLK